MKRANFLLAICTSSRYFCSASKGLTLAEMLVAVMIIGVIASLAVGQGLSIVRRERINAVALDLAGWIEQVRSLAMKEVNSTLSSGGCVVTFQAAANGLVGGATLATVSSACAPPNNGTTHFNGSFLVPRNIGSSVSTAFTQAGLSSSASPTVTFSPRGMWSPASGASGELIVKLLLDDGGPMRCVRISEALAFVDIGAVSTSSKSTSCASANYVQF
jgi:prepilin-type N-terminal cleavage/methylation domain-containing protein